MSVAKSSSNKKELLISLNYEGKPYSQTCSHNPKIPCFDIKMDRDGKLFSPNTSVCSECLSHALSKSYGYNIQKEDLDFLLDKVYNIIKSIRTKFSAIEKTTVEFYISNFIYNSFESRLVSPDELYFSIWVKCSHRQVLFTKIYYIPFPYIRNVKIYTDCFIDVSSKDISDEPKSYTFDSFLAGEVIVQERKMVLK